VKNILIFYAKQEHIYDQTIENVWSLCQLYYSIFITII